MANTVLGSWSVRFSVTFIALFVLIQIISAIGNSLGAFDGNSFTAFQIIIPIIVIPLGICAIASFVAGIVSIIRKKERSVLVFLTTVLGLCVLFFILGEFLFPH